MDFLSLLGFPAIVLVLGLVLRACAKFTAGWTVDKLSRRLGTYWNDETDDVLLRHFYEQDRAHGLGMALLVVPMMLASVPAALAADRFSTLYAQLAVFLLGMVAITAITYAKQAAARGAAIIPRARLRDVLRPFVLAVWWLGFALCVLAVAAYTINESIGAAEITSVWGVQYAAIGALCVVAVTIRTSFLPRNPQGMEYLYRDVDVRKLMGVGLTIPMLGTTSGFTAVSDFFAQALPIDPGFLVLFAYFGLVLAAFFVLEYRPYRVPWQSIHALSENAPEPAAL